MTKNKTKLFFKTKKASALVFSFMILTVMAIIAIALYNVSLTNIRMSTDTEKSVSSFQAADSGIEMVMQLINSAASTGTDKTIGAAGLCDSVPGQAVYRDEISFSGKVIEVAYFKPSPTGTGEVVRMEDCDAEKIDDIKELRSIGEFGGTVRAVAVNISQICPLNISDKYDSDIKYNSIRAKDGRCWLTTNLGVDHSTNITKFDDPNGYGWYFQWGRRADGHQIISPLSSSTTIASDSNPYPINGTGLFIRPASSPYDWINPQDSGTLWTETGGTNNPCPLEFHVPTMDEWDNYITAEGIKSCSSNCLMGSFNSSLKLTSAGYRERGTAGVFSNTSGNYASSTIYSTNLYFLNFDSSSVVSNGSTVRATGLSVRCIKD